MASYLDLVGQAIMLQREYDSRRNRVASAVTGASSPSFEGILQNSLQRMQSAPVSTPTRQDCLTEFDITSLTKRDDDFKKGINFVLAKEGSRLVKEDGGSGESSKFGILQSTARAFGYKGDVRRLTREGAEMIYRKLWEQSGASSLPFPLSVVHFDTYINSPAAAKRILAKSNGNIDTYLGMREKRYERLASRRPEVFAKYLNGWKARVQSLRTMVAAYTKANSNLYAEKNGNYSTKIG